MIRLLQRPFNYLWGIVPFVMALALYLNIDTAIDLQIQEAGFVISTFHLGVIFSMYLVFAGLMYYLFKSVSLSNWMTIVHVVLSMALPIGVLLVCEPITKNEISDTTANLLVIFTFVWILAQVLFLINLVRGAMRKEGGTASYGPAS